VHTAAGPDLSPPSAPLSPQATCSEGTITLDWQPNVEPDVASYIVQRTALVPQIAGSIEESVPAPPFTDTDLEPGTTIRYRVFAVDRSGNRSAASAPVPITVCGEAASPLALRMLDPWPNPFTETVVIPIEVPADKAGGSCRLLLARVQAGYVQAYVAVAISLIAALGVWLVRRGGLQ